VRKAEDRAGADSSAPARRLEAGVIAAVVAAAPLAAATVYYVYFAARTGTDALAGLGIGLAATAAFGVLGALAGAMAAFASGRGRSPLRIGASAGVSIFAGIVLGVTISSTSLHSEWYAVPIDLIGGAIVGPLMLILAYRLKGNVGDHGDAVPELGSGLRKTARVVVAGLAVFVGLAEFSVQREKQRRISSSVEHARERGVLVRELTLAQRTAPAVTPTTPDGWPLRIQEAWVEDPARAQFFGRSRSPEWERVVVRLRAGEPQYPVWIVTDSGRAEVLSKPSSRLRGDSTLLTATVRWAPARVLRFLTPQEARRLREQADSAWRARWSSPTP
jgi:hypothetical protein